MKSTLILNECGKCGVAQPPYIWFSDVSNCTSDPRESFLLMAKNYCEVQICFFSELQKWLNHVQLTNATNSITNTEHIDATAANTSDKELIRGTRELAKFLQCGCNRVCAINKSGILKREGIQFKLGNTYCYNKKKLTEVLSANPDLFADLHWH